MRRSCLTIKCQACERRQVTSDEHLPVPRLTEEAIDKKGKDTIVYDST